MAVGEASGEQPSETLVEDDNRKPPTPHSAGQRSRFHGGSTFSENKTCECTRSKTAVARASDVKCLFCGKVIDTKREQRRRSSSCCLAVEESATTSASETEPIDSALSDTLVTGLVQVPQTPEPALEDNQSSGDCSCQTIDQRTPGAVGRDGTKIPVYSKYLGLSRVCVCLSRIRFDKEVQYFRIVSQHKVPLLIISSHALD